MKIEGNTTYSCIHPTMAESCTCLLEDLSRWDLLKPLRESGHCNFKYFCVFRAHGGSGAIVINSEDEVFGLCSERGDINLFGITTNDGVDDADWKGVFRIDALCGKSIATISIGVTIGSALDSNGCLYWWGKNTNDQNVVQPPRLVKNPVDQSSCFIEVSCGHSFMAGLTLEGLVFVWGRLICSEFEGEEINVGLPIISLSCGAVHVALLASNGSVYTWGSGFDGQRGYCSFNEKDAYTVKKMELNEPCTSFACGPVSTVMLLASGKVWACGDNTEDLGYLGVASKTKKIKEPFRVNLAEKVSQIFVAWLPPKPYVVYVAVTANQEIYTWGPHDTPKPLPLGSAVIQAFYNTSTPRDIGMIPISYETVDQSMSASIEVISFSSSCTTKEEADLLNPPINNNCVKPATITQSNLFNTTDMLEFSAALFGTFKLSDLTFILKDSDFPGHRLFLCSRSRIFRELLDLDIPAHSKPVMDCKSYNPVAFIGLLQYLYTGHHVVEKLSDLLDLVSLSIKFGEGLLAEDAANQVTYILEPDNVLSVVTRAKAIPFPFLVEKCESYITYLAATKPDVMARLFMSMALSAQ